MRQEAIWFPFWYELDQSIHVDQVDEFFFFRGNAEGVAPRLVGGVGASVLGMACCCCAAGTGP